MRRALDYAQLGRSSQAFYLFFSGRRNPAAAGRKSGGPGSPLARRHLGHGIVHFDDAIDGPAERKTGLGKAGIGLDRRRERSFRAAAVLGLELDFEIAGARAGQAKFSRHRRLPQFDLIARVARLRALRMMVIPRASRAKSCFRAKARSTFARRGWDDSAHLSAIEQSALRPI